MDLIQSSQELHFQLFGKYIEDYQDSNAQIIVTHLQDFALKMMGNVDMWTLEIQADKIFLSDEDRIKYSNEQVG